MTNIQGGSANGSNGLNNGRRLARHHPRPEPVKVGIVGAGYWGPRLARTFQSLPECEGVIVCDRRPGRLRFTLDNVPGVEVIDDFERLLDDSNVDAIVIATEPTSHAVLAGRALSAGKHVLVEKPMTTNAADARNLVAQAQDKNRLLAVGHVYVHHPAVQWLMSPHAAGRLGPGCYAECVRVNLGPPHSDVDVIWDLASHDVSILLSLAHSPATAVSAYGRRALSSAHVDLAFMTIQFASGFIGLVHVSWLSALKVRRTFLVGTRGSALFDDTQATGKLVVSSRGPMGNYDPRDPDQSWDMAYSPSALEQPELPPILPLTAQCQEFIVRIRTGESPTADGSFGLAVVEVLEAATTSIQQGGRTVTLPIDPEPLMPVATRAHET